MEEPKLFREVSKISGSIISGKVFVMKSVDLLFMDQVTIS